MAYLSINETAKEVGLSACALRTMQKQGRCPGFFVGNRFYINVPLLLEQLERESRDAVITDSTTTKS